MTDHCVAEVESSRREELRCVGAPRGTRLQVKVYAVLARSGPMTADEVAEAMGESILNVRPRVSELAKQGMLKDSGHRGLTASGHTAAKWVLA